MLSLSFSEVKGVLKLKTAATACPKILFLYSKCSHLSCSCCTGKCKHIIQIAETRHQMVHGYVLNNLHSHTSNSNGKYSQSLQITALQKPLSPLQFCS